jgi:hypothetical protein
VRMIRYNREPTDRDRPGDNHPQFSICNSDHPWPGKSSSLKIKRHKPEHVVYCTRTNSLAESPTLVQLDQTPPSPQFRITASVPFDLPDLQIVGVCPSDLSGAASKKSVGRCNAVYGSSIRENQHSVSKIILAE